MPTLNRLGGRRPLMLTILLLIGWILVTAAVTAAAARLLGLPMTHVVPRMAGMALATGVLLHLTRRLGWLEGAGITEYGTRRVWLITLVLTIYVALAGWWGYFGDLTFETRWLMTPQARAILVEQVIVAWSEETVFRGVLLYGLIRAWGRTRRGLLTALLVQAALFGALHALQVLAGAPLGAALANVVNTLVFGLWLGALVLLSRTLWPAVVLHLLANALPLIKGLYSAWYAPAYLGYVRATLLELPLLLLGFLLLTLAWPEKRETR